MLKIKCKHCGNINEREYGDIKSDLRGNHFYKLRCSSCNKRTLVQYKFETIAMDDTNEYESTEQTLGKIVIE